MVALRDDKFPRCRICFDTARKLQSKDFRIRYKTLRNVSDYFISKESVRRYIFKHKGRKCYLCGSTEDLQIDHKISVCKGALEGIPYNEINSYENLMPVCRRCNSAKRVEEA